MKKYYLILLSIPILLTSCMSMSSLNSTLAPGASIDDLGKIFVIRFEPDERQLNLIIADQLSLMGYPAVAGEEEEIPEDVNTLVSYRDNWQWDMTNYMIRINIQFHHGKSRALIASGESYRTSLARRSPEEMIRETLEEILKVKKEN